MKKTKVQFLNVGGVSIIMIFMVLCLTMLGALAVSSAYGDLRLTERYHDNIELYYHADGAAQEKLFRLHEVLSREGAVQKSQLDAIIGTEFVRTGENFTGVFFEPIGEKQALQVQLRLEKKNSEYGVTVNSYKVVRSTAETYKSTWTLWDGTLPE